ncbi:MAG: hypothetical protein A2V69_01830 [Candidatus Portnoybacteria bacterium RBG_13_40_8]|uniref:Uncharacterized protein n=1 Tax=Candidatus Portnoybacteria bacterium RBG_13_40_8 TaxID=1801990 RepID=A0A1G2F5D1_9BACT|nr:MAG: hypothetical protein A2V69_01830 [Candidatus Portnoybacteria bacterium RBG_13_40_8]OGZ34738.1 MAG: hypothetical protein A2V60_02285 [Candidatus Portnoybacteria bacterium RIFCSPHIGHO2_01_FULL_39_19]
MIKQELIREIREKIEGDCAIFMFLAIVSFVLWWIYLLLFFFTGKAKALALSIWVPLINFPLNVLYCFAVILVATIILVVVFAPLVWIMQKREKRFLGELEEIEQFY